MKRHVGFKRPCLMTAIAVFFLCGSGLLAGLSEAAAIKDSESASHGAEDALHQIVDTYKFSRFRDCPVQPAGAEPLLLPLDFRQGSAGG